MANTGSKLTDIDVSQWINLPMIAIGMVVVVFALPLKAVKGDIKSKLKKIDYGGSALTLAWAVLILLPLSWYVFICLASFAFL